VVKKETILTIAAFDPSKKHMQEGKLRKKSITGHIYKEILYVGTKLRFSATKLGGTHDPCDSCMQQITNPKDGYENATI
jgi:hypothetical protein